MQQVRARGLVVAADVGEQTDGVLTGGGQACTELSPHEESECLVRRGLS
ncbi:hypothetical protein ACFXKI_32450 [Streptomyces mirabilis]